MQLEDHNENSAQLEKFNTRFRESLIREEKRWGYRQLHDEALASGLPVASTWLAGTAVELP